MIGLCPSICGKAVLFHSCEYCIAALPLFFTLERSAAQPHKKLADKIGEAKLRRK
ncbi:MAG: hypothetical protein KF685_09070 [Acidobacteria bacterium]|nr:hypothetical protein [Acidobacteriota bacterium]